MAFTLEAETELLPSLPSAWHKCRLERVSLAGHSHSEPPRKVSTTLPNIPSPTLPTSTISSQNLPSESSTHTPSPNPPYPQAFPSLLQARPARRWYGFRVSGFRFQVLGFEFRVSGLHSPLVWRAWRVTMLRPSLPAPRSFPPSLPPALPLCDLGTATGKTATEKGR